MNSACHQKTLRHTTLTLDALSKRSLKVNVFGPTTPWTGIAQHSCPIFQRIFFSSDPLSTVCFRVCPKFQTIQNKFFFFFLNGNTKVVEETGLYIEIEMKVNHVHVNSGVYFDSNVTKGISGSLYVDFCTTFILILISQTCTISFFKRKIIHLLFAFFFFFFLRESFLCLVRHFILFFKRIELERPKITSC